MDLGDERAGRVDHFGRAVLEFTLHLRRHAVRANDRRFAAFNLNGRILPPSLVAVQFANPELVPYLFWVSCYFALACGLTAVVGHVFSVFVRFKGGKGVATAAGVVLALSPAAIGAALAIGAFAATDAFLFYVLFEATLIPLYFLIGSFGGPNRSYAAVKFLIYNLVGGLLMLASIIGLAVAVSMMTGIWRSSGSRRSACTSSRHSVSDVTASP